MTTPSSPYPPRPITSKGEAVLRVMQRRPLDWWYTTAGGIAEELKGTSMATYTVVTGLCELEDNGLITHRWEPLPGETEEEARQAVAQRRQAEKVARDALPWWRRWRVDLTDAETFGPRRRSQYRLTDRGRGTTVKSAVKEGARHPLGRPLLPGPV